MNNSLNELISKQVKMLRKYIHYIEVDELIAK